MWEVLRYWWVITIVQLVQILYAPKLRILYYVATFWWQISEWYVQCTGLTCSVLITNCNWTEFSNTEDSKILLHKLRWNKYWIYWFKIKLKLRTQINLHRSLYHIWRKRLSASVRISEKFVLALVLHLLIWVSMCYFQALDSFNTAVVAPVYYVMFTILTIFANMIMYKVMHIWFFHERDIPSHFPFHEDKIWNFHMIFFVWLYLLLHYIIILKCRSIFVAVVWNWNVSRVQLYEQENLMFTT
jgi:hypothetical protein